MEELDEIIDRYVAGNMEEAERFAFEERIRNDESLARRVVLYKDVSQNLAAWFGTQRQENRMKQTLAAIDREYFDDVKHVSPGFSWYKWAAAACVALLCGVFFYSTFFTRPTYDEFAIYEPMAIAERGETGAVKTKAQATFNAKQYAKAIPYFDSLLMQDPANMEVRLYKGISLLELDSMKEAENIFDSVRNSTSAYSDEAVWMLALSALKRKDFERCRELLLQVDSGSSVHKKASELLKKL